MTAKNLSWLCEVPRVFTTVAASDAESCISKLKEEMGTVVDKFAIVEDITGKHFPDKRDAMMSKSSTLLGKVTNIYNVASDIAMVTGSSKIQGLGEPDLILGKDVFTGLGGSGGKGDYISLNSFLDDTLKKGRSSSKAAAAKASAAVAEEEIDI